MRILQWRTREGAKLVETGWPGTRDGFQAGGQVPYGSGRHVVDSIGLSHRVAMRRRAQPPAICLFVVMAALAAHSQVGSGFQTSAQGGFLMEAAVRNRKCCKCAGKTCELGEMHVAGGFRSKILDVEGRKFSSVTCARCKHTEFFKADLSQLANICDLFLT